MVHGAGMNENTREEYSMLKLYIATRVKKVFTVTHDCVIYGHAIRLTSLLGEF